MEDQLTTCVITHLPSVHSHAHGTVYDSVHVLCNDKLLKEFEIKLKPLSS